MLYLCLLITAILSFTIIQNRNKLARYLDIFDDPSDHRKVHDIPVPAIGGTVLIVILIFFNSITFFNNNKNFENNAYLIIFLLMSYTIGLYDDKQKINIKLRVIFITLNYFFLLILEPSFKITKIYIENPNLVIPISNFYLSFFVTIFCVFLLYNCINFLDGVNGNLILLTLFWLFIYFIKSSQYDFIVLTLIVTLFVCLIYNLQNKIFMGNSGSLLISSILSFLYLSAHNNEYKVFFSEEVVVLFLIPGFDMIRLFFLRILNKQNPFLGDQNHLHHLLIRKFKSKNIFFLYFIITIIPYLVYVFIKINIFLVLLIIFGYFLAIIKFLSGFSYNNKIL